MCSYIMDNILSTFPYFTTPVQNEAFQDLVGTHFGGKYRYLCIFLNDEVLLISKWKNNNDMLKKKQKKINKKPWLYWLMQNYF